MNKCRQAPLYEDNNMFSSTHLPGKKKKKKSYNHRDILEDTQKCIKTLVYHLTAY